MLKIQKSFLCTDSVLIVKSSNILGKINTVGRAVFQKRNLEGKMHFRVEICRLTHPRQLVDVRLHLELLVRPPPRHRRLHQPLVVVQRTCQLAPPLLQ